MCQIKNHIAPLYNFFHAYGHGSTDFNVVCIPKIKLRTYCDNILLSRHWFFMSGSRHVCNGFSNCSLHWMQTFAQNISKFLKPKYRTVAIAMSSITGRCKSVCCNLHEESVTRQAGGGIVMMVLEIVKTSHYMEQKLMKIRVIVHVEKYIIVRGLG